MHPVYIDPRHALYIGLDVSGSMQRRDCPILAGEQLPSPRLDYARLRLRELLVTAPATMVTQLLTFGTELRVWEGAGPGLLLEQLREVTASESGTCMGAALAAVLSMQPETEPASVLLITDGPPSDGELLAAACEQNLRRAEPLTLHLLALGRTEVDLRPLHVQPLYATELALSEGRPTQPSLPPVPAPEDVAMRRALELEQLERASTEPPEQLATPPLPREHASTDDVLLYADVLETVRSVGDPLVTGMQIESEPAPQPEPPPPAQHAPAARSKLAAPAKHGRSSHPTRRKGDKR